MSTNYDIELRQGVDFSLTVTLDDGATPTPAPIDVTDWTAHMQARPSVDDIKVLFSFTEADGVIFGGVDGRVTLSFSAEQTRQFDWLNGVYDLYVTDTAKRPRCLLAGTICVVKAVTR